MITATLLTARTFSRAKTASIITTKLPLQLRNFITTTAASSSAKGGHTSPRVGVGVILLRHLIENNNPEVLLIRRGKPPSMGLWSFCGGSLELGESLVECAMREVREETGLILRHKKDVAPGTSVFYRNLAHPAVFSAVDVIDREPSVTNGGPIRFHYAVVEVAGLPEDYRAVPVAADDADEVQWVDVKAMKTMNDLVVNAVAVLEEALARFEIPKE
jgi:ADP-ribose pyrophosphatase YjhB (NUDIX family)